MLHFMLTKRADRYWLYTKDGPSPATSFSTTNRDDLWYKLITMCMKDIITPDALHRLSLHLVSNEWGIWESDLRP